MSNVRIFSVTFAVAFLLLSGTSYGEPGDCDGNGVGGTVADFVHLTEYLFENGPPPPSVRTCDCDNYPGLNYGDLWQLREHLEDPSIPLYDSPGSDFIGVRPRVKFMVLGRPDGETVTEAAILHKRFRDDIGLELVDGLMLVLSFYAGPGEADLDCIGIDFAGSAATELTGDYDNDSKTLWIWNYEEHTTFAWPEWALLATAHFVQDPDGSPGNGVELRPWVSDARRPIIMGECSYWPGLALGVRVNYPVFVPQEAEQVGDVNCDDAVDIDDVVYLIEWIFVGGPPPGDPDDDGIPDC